MWPLVCHNLITHFDDVLPEAVQLRLHAEHKQQRLYSRTRSATLLDVLRRLQNEDIACMPLKGPVLAQQLYGNPGARGFGDIDVLVRPHDVPRARTILLAAGFERGYAPTLDDSCLELGIAPPFVKGRLTVELHPSLLAKVYAFPLDTDDQVFRRARTLSFDGTDVRVLSPEDLLIYLCAHGAKHAWPGLRLIGDIAALSAQLNAHDWQRAVALARETRCERLLWYGLSLSRNLLDGCVPDEIQARMVRDRTTNRMAARVQRTLLGGDATGSGLLHRVHSYAPIADFLAWFPLRDQRVERWTYALRMFARPTYNDRAAVKLPRRLSALHVVLRPLRVLVQVSRVAFARS